MTEHLSAQLVERYCRRTISPAELLAADQHLSGCDACRQRLSEAGQLKTAYHKLLGDLRAAASHLDYEQLAAYVKDELSETDRLSVESHLRACSACRTELDDLRAFAVTINRSKTYQPPLNFWEKLLAALQARPQALLLGAAALAAAVIVAGISLRLLRTPQPGDIAKQASPTPSSLPTTTPGGATTPTPAVSPATSPRATEAPSSPVFAFLTLTPSAGRGGGEDEIRFEIQPEATVAQITLAQVEGDYRSYAASLQASEGREVWSQRGLRAQPARVGRNLVLKIPAKLLVDGKYTLTVKGVTAQQEEKTAGTYSFTVRRM